MKILGCATVIKGKDSAAPAEALRATGEKGALWLETATASTPRKKADRIIAPRLPESSYTTSARGFLSIQVRLTYNTVEQENKGIPWECRLILQQGVRAIDCLIFA